MSLQLEIIEEGLHMKLELKNIKQQFLSLLENYETYQTRAPPPPPAAMRAAAGVPLTDDRPVSAPRARVRALYEARRARLHARRSVSGNVSSSSTGSTPRQRSRALRDSDKENRALPDANSKSRGHSKDNGVIPCDQKYHRKLTTSTPFCKPHKHCACHPRVASNSQLLTPIKEEALRQRLPFSPTNGTTSPTFSDLEGEYVTLRGPEGDGVVSMEVDSYPDSNVLYQTRQSPLTMSGRQDQTSIWVNSSDNLDGRCPHLGTADDSTADGDKENQHRPPPSSRRRSSPVKYASSDVISELYTSTSLSNLKDVSQISRLSMSNQTLREQSSGSNISGGHLHSTFNYPLHSTLNYPLDSTINFPADPSPPRRAPRQGDPDTLTTVSEPSALLRRRGASPKDSRSLDDSLVDIRSLQKSSEGRMTVLSTDSAVSRRNKSRTARTRRRERLKQREKEAAMTPLTHREPQLCKEHGLHPTFGGPCIFQTDDSFTLSETTTEDDDADDVRPRSSTAVTETDNDSSYLSECVDDSSSHFGQSNCRAEDFTATYDARNGRMRMLRRQTGQAVLDKTNLRDPIGLSESDIMMDVTRKHLSLEATRSSLPDLSALSTTTTATSGTDDYDLDVSEDTLHASQVMRDSDGGLWSPASLDDTVVGVGRVGASCSQRPLSVSTSTTTTSTNTDNTSPESTGDLPVPVNSPNVTDSGSSRPTTDTYDYVDVPKFEVMGPPVHLPPRHQNVRRRHHPGTRPPCTVGRHATASSSSGENAGPDGVAPDPMRYETRSEGRGARKCLRYHHDYDSGFSTPGSGRRTQSGHHILLSDAAGNTRTVVQHSAVARNLQHDRKKQLVKKLKQFSNNFYKSTGNLHIHTLGHF